MAESTSYEALHYGIFSSLPLFKSLSVPGILLSALFSYTLSPCCSLTVRNKASHSCETTGEIIRSFGLHVRKMGFEDV
jgi:hypothetical protein